MFDGDLLAERSRVTPDKVALVSIETGERLTYAQLNERATRAAASLLRAGVRPGDRFGLLAYNCIEFIALFFGAGKAGAIVVPLPVRATAHELWHVVADSGMTVLFYGVDFAETVKALPVSSSPLSVINERPSERVQSTPGEQRKTTTTSEDTYCLLYTSGTTGKPKGVMIPRRQLLWNGYNTAINWALRDDDVSPIFTPLYHAGGLAAFLIPIFCAGGTMILHKSFDARMVWQTIERERCTVVLGVPTIWKILMDAAEFRDVNLDHVRWFISGGAPLPAYIIEAYQKRGVVFKQGYGMTEVGVNCFTMTVDDSFRKPGSIGRPMMFTDVKLVAAGGSEAGAGGVGEMYIRGPHVSTGYWNNVQATNDAFLDGGWFRTGDLARYDEDGFFYIAGRAREMFISGGVNVYPAEIEAELVSHPAVADAAIVAVADDHWGETGVAFVVSTATAEVLIEYLTTRLSKYKVPKRFVFLDALPRSPYGKVEKVKLKDML